jgi:hypothetical protein
MMSELNIGDGRVDNKILNWMVASIPEFNLFLIS